MRKCEIGQMNDDWIRCGDTTIAYFARPKKPPQSQKIEPSQNLAELAELGNSLYRFDPND